jgi:hypothetical protein
MERRGGLSGFQQIHHVIFIIIGERILILKCPHCGGFLIGHGDGEGRGAE